MLCFLAGQLFEDRNHIRAALTAHPVGEIRIIADRLLLHLEGDSQQFVHRFHCSEGL